MGTIVIILSNLPQNFGNIFSCGDLIRVIYGCQSHTVFPLIKYPLLESYLSFIFKILSNIFIIQIAVSLFVLINGNQIVFPYWRSTLSPTDWFVCLFVLNEDKKQPQTVLSSIWMFFLNFEEKN